MKIIPILRIRHYIAKVSVLLIMLALIAGIVGCDGGGSYLTLTIDSTEGGNVTTPGEGTFSYFAPQCCPHPQLVAEADEGYCFVEWTWTGKVGAGIDPDSPITYIQLGGDASVTAHFGCNCTTAMVAAGGFHTVGLRDSGKLVAVGNNDAFGQCNINGWADIIQVAAGDFHTVGLRDSGKLVAVGNNEYGQCDVGGWGNITQVSAGGGYTVGLKSDRTAVAVGNNDWGQCNVDGWTDIIQVAAGGYHTVGLKADGTVVGVGQEGQRQQEFGSWTDIVQVDAGNVYTVGLKSDGTVVIAGSCVCDVSGWTNITQIAAGPAHTVGLEADGVVVAAGNNEYGQCDVTGWTLIS
jgi:alpha-tubulin suppressor-like RCC1 family protein